MKKTILYRHVFVEKYSPLTIRKAVIKKCLNSSFWYSHSIGKQLNVRELNSEEYKMASSRISTYQMSLKFRVVGNDGIARGYIEIEDCEIIK